MSNDTTWQTVVHVERDELIAARLQLHYGSQLVSAVGATLLPPAPDDSHPNLGWSSEHRALAGRPLADIPVQAALRLADPAVLVRREGSVVATIDLAGLTMDDARCALGRVLSSEGVRLPHDGLAMPNYELPDHPLNQGAAFSSGDHPAYEQLARWYGDAAQVFEDCIRVREAAASSVRCWPHHFDLATLISEQTGADGVATRTIGVGLSPGDGVYPLPYWYVSPWPYPQEEALAALPWGRWHTDGYTAAILDAEQVTAERDGDGQRQLVESFIQHALLACRDLYRDAVTTGD